MGRGRRMWDSSSSGVATGTPAVTVDVEKCIGCGNCASACPFGAIAIVDGRAKVDPARCRGCRICTNACPTGAIG